MLKSQMTYIDFEKIKMGYPEFVLNPDDVM